MKNADLAEQEYSDTRPFALSDFRAQLCEQCLNVIPFD